MISRFHECLRTDRFSNHFANDFWLSPEGWPNNRFRTLISSSRSFQWIPSPLPISLQLLRSLTVACLSRGYQTKGTIIVRPSIKWTVISSLVTVTSDASACTSSVEILIPTPHQVLLILRNQLFN